MAPATVSTNGMRKMSACFSTLKGSRAKKTFIEDTQLLKQNGILSIFDEKLSLMLRWLGDWVKILASI